MARESALWCLPRAVGLYKVKNIINILKWLNNSIIDLLHIIKKYNKT